MTSGENVPLSVGEIFKRDYFETSGMSISGFAKVIGVAKGTLSKVLSGKCQMGFNFIDKINSYTGSSIRDWHYLQSDYQFASFRSCRKRVGIAPLSVTQTLPRKKNPLVDELFRNHLLPAGQNIALASAQLEMGVSALSRIINGRRAIDRHLAEKLYSTLGINPLYWLKLQTFYEISALLKSGRLPAELEKHLSEYSQSIATREFSKEGEGSSSHPGQILKDQFIAPFGNRLGTWCKVFRISRRKLLSILEGTALMPISLMLKVYRLFEIDICYWLDLQINYHVRLLTEWVAPIDRGLKNSLKPCQAPGSVLYKEYIIPMKWNMNDFADHIGISRELLRNIRYGEKAIDFEVACRLGEALEMDPNYWVRLQLDHSINLYYIRSTRLNV